MSWTETDQAVLSSLHAEYSCCSRNEDLNTYNKDAQQHVTGTAFFLMTFRSSLNSHTEARQVAHSQISTTLSDLTAQTTGYVGFVWIDLVDLSSLPTLAHHYDIHEACVRGTL